MLSGTLALALMYGLAPIAFKLAAVALVWRHPLDAAQQRALRRHIDHPSVRTDAPAAPAAGGY